MQNIISIHIAVHFAYLKFLANPSSNCARLQKIACFCACTSFSCGFFKQGSSKNQLFKKSLMPLFISAVCSAISDHELHLHILLFTALILSSSDSTVLVVEINSAVCGHGPARMRLNTYVLLLPAIFCIFSSPKDPYIVTETNLSTEISRVSLITRI